MKKYEVSIGKSPNPLEFVIVASNERIASRKFGCVLILFGVIPCYSQVDLESHDKCVVCIKSIDALVKFDLYYKKGDRFHEDFEDCTIIAIPVCVQNQLSLVTERLHESLETEHHAGIGEQKENTTGDISVDTLKQVFNLKSFRPYQREVAEAIFAGKDVLSILSTGSGKTPCFLLPAIVFERVTMVIVPLLSLMYDLSMELFVSQ